MGCQYYAVLLVLIVIGGMILGIVTHIRNATENPIEDTAKIVKRFKGSIMLGASAIEELILTDIYVLGRCCETSGYTKRNIHYEDIAEVRITKGLIGCDLEIMNRGSGGNVLVKGLSHEDARNAQSIIYDFRKLKRDGHNNQNVDRYAELEKLANLRTQGIITEDEFILEKQKILRGKS